ncbi:universal stress protein [Pedobacter sp. SL55]|uniref:universal stress protein n=1 Tax=Pedobacter sp. SL55 TaxID=2995161 RepID=UPI003B63FCD0
MKDILVLTDFSQAASHAVHYAYYLAVSTKANLTLCNAITIPAETPLASFVSWPMEKSGALIEESDRQLEKLRKRLDRLDYEQPSKPQIRGDQSIRLFEGRSRKCTV